MLLFLDVSNCPVMRVLWVPSEEAGSCRLCPRVTMSQGLGTWSTWCATGVSAAAIYKCMEGALLCVPSAPPCFAALTARAWLLQGLPDLSCDLGLDGDLQEDSLCLLQESRGSLRYLSLHLCAFLVVFSAHHGLRVLACLNTSPSACCPSLPHTVPSAQLGAVQPRTTSPWNAGSTRPGATWLNGGTPGEVSVNTCMLASHGALVQPCTTASHLLSHRQGPGRFGTAQWQPHWSLLGAGGPGSEGRTLPFW